MSGFGPSGGPPGYDESDIERQIEDVYRRSRQQAAAVLQQQGGPPPPPGAYGSMARHPDAYSMGILGAADAAAAQSPYYARLPPSSSPVAASPYARGVPPSHPYLMGGPPPPPPPPDVGSMGMYPPHHPAHGPPSPIKPYPGYGAPPPHSASPTTLGEDRFVPPPPHPSYGIHPASAASTSSSSPAAVNQSGGGSSSPISSQAAQEIAIMQEAFHRERKNSLKRHGAYTGSHHTPVPTPTSSSSSPSMAAAASAVVAATLGPSSAAAAAAATHTPSPRTPSSSSSLEHSSSGASGASGGASGGGSSTCTTSSKPAFTSRALRLPPPTKTNAGQTPTSAVLSKDTEGKWVVEDRGNMWYMGAVPLGVEDDKYWLSELQVYLRANFAEAFAATEEDIAAPMHGRNKPIALGQVGIRCMHCKCTCFWLL